MVHNNFVLKLRDEGNIKFILNILGQYIAID